MVEATKTLENKIKSVNKDLALILGKLAYHTAPEIVDYIAELNERDYEYFKIIFSGKIAIEHYLFPGSACVFPGTRRYISNHNDVTRKYNKEYRAIIDDNVFPRYIWCYLASGKCYSGPTWKSTGLNDFELAHIFTHKESEIDNEKDFFQSIDKKINPYGDFTSAANVVLLPKGTVRPTDNSTMIKAVFYKRYIELYGEKTLNGRRGFIEANVPDWYSDIKWNAPFLPDNWKHNIDDLIKYRNDKIASILGERGKTIKPPNNSTGIISDTQKLQIEFVPSDEELFKQELIKTKEAGRTWYYSNGKTKTDYWHADKFTENSNLRGNIMSNNTIRQWKTLGIVKIKFEIVQ
jgi:hypothetical protein